jgi:hypothetical protein
LTVTRKRENAWQFLQGGGMQHRRRLGRKYLHGFGWFTLALNCVMLALVAKRYFAGKFQGSVGLHYAAGMLAGFVISAILIIAAKSK